MEWLIVLVVLPLVVSAVGQFIKRVVLGKKPWGALAGWRAWFDVSLPVQAWALGAAAGLACHASAVPFPEAVFGDQAAGYLLGGLCSGMIAQGVGYDGILSVFRRALERVKVG